MRLIILMIAFFGLAKAYSQPLTDSTVIKKAVDSVNRFLDKSVVKKDFEFMQKHFADDFYFQHATGKIDSKTSWIGAAKTRQTNFISREHDSTVVELHDNIAIVSGILNVRFPPNTRKAYAV